MHSQKLKSRLEVISQSYTELMTVDDFEQTIKLLKGTFSKLSFLGSFMSGIPLPNQSIRELIIENSWASAGLRSFTPPADDLVFMKAVDWPNPFILKDEFKKDSLFGQALPSGDDIYDVLIAPVLSVRSYQGVVACYFSRTSVPESGENQSITLQERILFSALINFAFEKLHSINHKPFIRKGELTNREKEVISISSLGYTSLETAKILGIKERTIVTHLQNASLKLGTRNRIESVLQAIRYRQTGPGAGRGFYQIQHELYNCPL